MPSSEIEQFFDYSPFGQTSFSQFLAQSTRHQSQVVLLMKGTLNELGAARQFQARGWEEQHSIQRAGFTALTHRLSNIDASLSTANDSLSSIDQSVRNGTSQVASALRWGFSSLVISIGRLEEVLHRIDQKLGAPARTGAEEFYLEACHLYQHGLYSDALDYVNWAIHGRGNQPGRKIDPRFHYLLGRITIGSWLGKYPNTSIRIVDLRTAERAFWDAWSYGRVVKTWREQAERGEAMLYSARASYLRKDLGRAITNNAVALKWLEWLFSEVLRQKPNLEGFKEQLHALILSGKFQRAKYLYAAKRSSEAEPDLLWIFGEDVEQVVLAKSDPDIVRDSPALNRAIATHTRRLAEQFESICGAYARVIETIRRTVLEKFEARLFLADELREAEGALRTARAETASGGVLDYAAALTLARTFTNASDFLALFRKRYEAQCRAQAEVRLAPASATLRTLRADLYDLKRRTQDTDSQSTERVTQSLFVTALSSLALAPIAALRPFPEGALDCAVLLLVAYGLFSLYRRKTMTERSTRMALRHLEREIARAEAECAALNQELQEQINLGAKISFA